MKNVKIVFVTIASYTVAAAVCQTSTGTQQAPQKDRKIKITDASVLGGVMSQNLPLAGSVSDFQKLNPQSVLLQRNLDGNSTNEYGYDMGFGSHTLPGGSGVFGANLGFSFKEKPKSLTQLRCGIAVSGISISNSMSKTESIPYDTLTSGQTGQTIYYDSVITSGYNMNYFARQLRLDISLIYRIYPAARWSLYGGAGMEGGTSLMAYTDINYSEHLTVGSEEANYNPDDAVYHSERIINKPIQEYVAYLPVGVDFRVGKKKEFFQQIHLFTELRPFISVVNIPELGTFSNTGIKNVVGLRVVI